MPTYSELQVFKTSYDLMILVFRSTPNIAREYRFTLLENIKIDLVDLCTEIYRTNNSTDKLPHIEKSLELAMQLKLRCRIMVDLGQISKNLFSQIITHTTSINSQLKAWHKYHLAHYDSRKPNQLTIEGIL